MKATSSDNDATHLPKYRIGGPLAWTIWALGGLSFGYAFFHRVAPSVMVNELMRDFDVGGAALGNLSALYFYAYAGLQLPIGIILDRFGARVTLSVSLLICAIGGLIFATADTILMAYTGRLLVGVGSGVGFLGSLVLISQWFPQSRFALLTGSTMTIAMLTAVGSQAPLALIVAANGWRNTLIYGSLVGLLLALATGLIIRNSPDPAKLDKHHHVTWGEFGRQILTAFRIPQVWVTAFISITMSGFLLGFGALWGIPYMMVRYGIDRPVAGAYVSAVFLGWAVGAPLSGWLADHVQRRKSPIVLAALVNTLILIALFLIPDLPIAVAGGLIFLGGAIGAVMINCYAYIREMTNPKVHGAIMGLINGFTVGSGAVLQPLIGYLLDLNWTGQMVDGARAYSLDTYTIGMWAIIITAFLGFLATLAMRETYCRSQFDPDT